MISPKACLGSLAILAAVTASCARGSTVAFWNFEQGADSALVPHAGANGAFDGQIPDLSGNGNSLSAFGSDPNFNFYFTNVTPYSKTPGTGATNTLALVNSGAYPALTSSPVGTSVPGGIDLSTIQPTTWTIEATYKPENNNNWRTIIGRDAENITATGGDQNLAALYFQLTPDNHFRVQYIDAMGVVHAAQSAVTITDGYSYDPNNPIHNTNGVAHGYAAVNDGNNLTLYIDGQQVAQTLLTGTSTNLALNNGSSGTAGASDWTAGEWSVFRGLYAGGHGDRAYGQLDDVRISDAALAPSQFLASPTPEPTPFVGMAVVSAAGLLKRRRRHGPDRRRAEV